MGGIYQGVSEHFVLIHDVLYAAKKMGKHKDLKSLTSGKLWWKKAPTKWASEPGSNGRRWPGLRMGIENQFPVHFLWVVSLLAYQSCLSRYNQMISVCISVHMPEEENSDTVCNVNTNITFIFVWQRARVRWLSANWVWKRNNYVMLLLYLWLFANVPTLS